MDAVLSHEGKDALYHTIKSSPVGSGPMGSCIIRTPHFPISNITQHSTKAKHFKKLASKTFATQNNLLLVVVRDHFRNSP